jgi:hypothetical protein
MFDYSGQQIVIPLSGGGEKVRERLQVRKQTLHRFIRRGSISQN